MCVCSTGEGRTGLFFMSMHSINQMDWLDFRNKAFLENQTKLHINMSFLVKHHELFLSNELHAVSIPGHTCRPSRLELFPFFFKARVNTRKWSAPRRALHP